ncbi:MAG: PD-(D/E)XK motif protein [Candidatus Cloacimonetes bacterium]|nr:PD-(D/E)XK motif protein [Candidatus Cloacimonadota bacterium]
MNSNGIGITEKFKTWWKKNCEMTLKGSRRYGIIEYQSRHNWYVGWDSQFRKEFYLESSFSVDISSNAYSSESINCYETVKDTGTFVIHFVLLNDANTDVFAALGQDLINVAEPLDDEQAVPEVLKRFCSWKQMLQKGHMDIAQYQGLFGELVVLRELLHDDGMKICDVINGWTGPEGDKQDFVLPDKWFECKTVAYKRSEITITSLAQLNRIDIPGYLYVVKINTSEKEIPDYFSVKKLFESIKENELKYEPELQYILDQKISEFKYSIYLVEHAFWFKVEKISLYEVTEDFPKLPVPEKIPSSIQSVTYTLSLPGLECWRMEEK